MIVSTQQPTRPRLAIIGAGISGLTAAFKLHEEYDLTVFESNHYIGGHTNTIDVDTGSATLPIDTGFIVYNERNYPNFTSMLHHLNVDTQPTEMSFSVRSDHSGLEYNGTSINGLFAQRSNLIRPRFYRLIRDILRFNRIAPEALGDSSDHANMTVDEFVRSHHFGDDMVDEYLVPMGAAIWSCPAATFRDFPIRFVVEFFRNHALIAVSGRPQWRVIRGGSRNYVKPLTRGFADRIRLNCPVDSVRRDFDGVTIRTGSHGEERFDHVIFACHADQALRLLQDPSDTERDLLTSFPYQPNDAVLHTDTSLLPKRRLAWAAWNYHVREDRPDHACVTYNMNILQGLDTKETYCVTLNETDQIDPARILRTFRYAHPVYTHQRKDAQARHQDVIDTNRTSFCGAYWGYGFHEDGVNSALAVTDALEGAAVR